MSLMNTLEKKPFQAYTIEHGIERIRIKIPLRESRAFEQAFQKAQEQSASKTELMNIVKTFNGSIRAESRGAK